jgi:1-acyl-sn-glycerol-3-phosphate acyltransferase
VARLVLQAGVPVIPVAMINTEFVPSGVPGIKTIRRPGIRIGKPMDFTAYGSAGNNRAVLRYVTDEIMNAVMELSGQVYVDAYGSSVKEALEQGRDFPVRVLGRPGDGKAPPLPAQTGREPLTSTDPRDLPPAVGDGTR